MATSTPSASERTCYCRARLAFPRSRLDSRLFDCLTVRLPVFIGSPASTPRQSTTTTTLAPDARRRSCLRGLRSTTTTSTTTKITWIVDERRRHNSPPDALLDAHARRLDPPAHSHDASHGPKSRPLLCACHWKRVIEPSAPTTLAAAASCVCARARDSSTA